MNYYLQQHELKHTATLCRHLFANNNGNGGMRLQVKENPLARIVFDQRNLLTTINGEPMF